MKVYFTASLRGKEQYGKNYKYIVELLQGLDYQVESDHVLKESPESVDDVSDEYRVEYYKKMLKWIASSDIVVAELTDASSSIGHEVTLALEKEKPVVALCEKGKIPNIFKAIRNDKFFLLEYEDLNVDLKRILLSTIKKAQKTVDIRFNFFVSPKISNYLDWVSREKRIPRSVYLRRLIEEDMKNFPEFTQ